MARGRRRPRRGGARPPVVTSDGDGYLIGLELEAKLFGRVRLLTIDATAAVSDGAGAVLDVTPVVVGSAPAAARRLGPPPRSIGPGRRRAGLEEAAALVREAREMLSVEVGTGR